MPVNFIATSRRGTGYGSAVANFKEAFVKSEIRTQFNIFTDHPNRSGMAFGKQNILDFHLHLPPYNIGRNNKKIVYFYWETDKLPKIIIDGIRHLKDVWVPCELTRQACLRSGYRGSLKVVPTPHDDWSKITKIEMPANKLISPETYKFYSVFQWHNRKGYDILLNAYYKAFNENDNVILILKVNPLGNGYDKIKQDILNIKKNLNLKWYPPIYLSRDLVSKGQIGGLHDYGDCFVSSHHGEGWGMPIHDAMYFGNQIITTKYGGVTEFLDESSAHLINYKLGPVSGMDGFKIHGQGIYDPSQKWAYPDVNHLTFLLQDVYKNHANYSDKAEKARRMAAKMNIESVAKILSQELSGYR